MKWIWITSGSFLIIASVVSSVLGKEAYFKRKKMRLVESLKETYELSQKGLRHALHHHVLLYLMVNYGLFGYAFAVFIAGWQPFFKDVLGISPVYFGIIGAVVAFSSFIALNISRSLERKSKLGKDLLIVLLTFSTAGFLIFTGIPIVAISLIGFGFLWVFFDLSEPVRLKYFNQHVPSKSRATVNSVNNMFSILFWAAGFYVGYGIISELFGLTLAFYVAIVISIIGIFTLYLIKD